MDSTADTAEAAESEYFSVDDGDLVPVEKHSRSHSLALSNGCEFLSCLDEEESRSQCSDDTDSYTLYAGHEEEEEPAEEKAVDPPVPARSWLR